MIIEDYNSTPLYYRPKFAPKEQKCWDEGVIYASFSRLGGVSLSPYDSLNVSFSVGDDPLLVYENIRIIRNSLGLKSINMADQIHGNNIIQIDQDNSNIFTTLSDADGFITKKKGQGLLIKHADCQSICFFDPKIRAVANIHCGWRGLVNGIIEKAILLLKDMGSNPSDIFAVISPSLGPCCFEFRDWKKLLPLWMHNFIVRERYLDAWAVTEFLLKNYGISEKRMFNFRICTKCSPLHFSYRRSPVSGRLATVIALKK